MQIATATDVLCNAARWSCECADVLAWLAGLPDDSVDLLFTSPPYLEARTYGAGLGKPLEEWVAWMVEVVRAAAPKVRGLIAINCEASTRNYQYLPGPYLLMADLHRAGFNLRRPAFFHRVGIPGSGGPDWLRADIEPIVCVTRPGKLPWSDNTACGHPPKWAPGGEMSHRLSGGSRVNEWGGSGKNTFRMADGTLKRQTGKASQKPTQTKAERKLVRTKQGPGREGEEETYTPPVLANPGNVLQQTYTADEVVAMLAHASEVTHHVVGGGQMGHPAAHSNEAPFPLELPAFFVKSFCPPDGVCCDPFSGSGTTIDAAVQNGRRGIGADIRQSQVDLVRRRMGTVTGPLFAT